jgi:hypothetical protein
MPNARPVSQPTWVCAPLCRTTATAQAATKGVDPFDEDDRLACLGLVRLE